MQSLIRERFWIIRARKTIKSILNECFICARFKVKSLSSGPSPLPPDRVNDCAIFEVVGIDLAGPLFLKTGEKELIPLTPAMFLIENRCSDTTNIDELNSRDLRKRMKYRIKLLSDLRQRFRKEYLSELIQKQNDNRVREPQIGEMVLIGNDNKKRLSWPIAKIIELIPGRDGEIRTVRLKTQHGTVIRPVQRIFPLEVQAIANSDKKLKEESISVKSTKPEKVLNTNDVIVRKYTSSGRLVKEPKRLDLLNYNCYRGLRLSPSLKGGSVLNSIAAKNLSCQVIYSQFGLAIHQNDHQARRRLVEWAQNEIAVVPDFHKRILFSDEAHFWLNGYVNKQNCRIWSEANPQVYVETPLHPEKLTVWIALWAGGILLQKRLRPQRYSQ
ncbi:integrase catalytic domain-containing protein [Trichonephila clavipes]|nr:integrase catalytic domain-containing protein [Trichonephila clavipes]